VGVRTISLGGEDVLQQATSNVADPHDKHWGPDAIAPLYKPEDCYATYEMSGILPPNVSAYATNIEGFGHRLEPTIDLDGPDAAEKVRDAMLLERQYDGLPTDVTSEDVAARMLDIRNVMRLERLQLEAFFENCCPEMSFIELRDRKRHDEEIAGNAYWEVVRDLRGFISEFNLVPSVTVRLTKRDKKVETYPNRRISATALRRTRIMRRFRRFVQVIDGIETVWFKEYGDSRVLSSRTGKFFASTEALCAAEGDESIPATEIIHWKLLTTRQPYGIPRWIGCVPSVKGERQAQEVNQNHFDNNAIPPGILLCSGGTVGEGAEEKIKDAFKARRQKGPLGAHEIIIIEAEPAETNNPMGSPPVTKLEWINLRGSQLQDATHAKYTELCKEAVAEQFRVPKILLGDMTDYNRATAESALETVEQQVFQPPRAKFDHVMNQDVLPEMGVRFWKFVSNGLTIRNPQVVSEYLERLVKADIMLPAEARPIAADAIGKPLDPIKEDWAKKPFTELAKPAGTGDTMKDMVAMRHALDARASASFAPELDAARRAEAEPEDDEEPGETGDDA
jgi:PBSX family phage portal protein